MKTNPMLLKDFYKTGHVFQYPEGTTVIYSNFTPRGSRIEGIDNVVVFGLQYLIKEYLIKQFNENFFNKPKEKVITEYKRRMDTALGPDSIPVDHIESLHDLGYLPILIKALPEGTRCPMRVPVMTIQNTHPGFSWITNMLETLLSSVLWGMMNSATIADKYKQILKGYAIKTSDSEDFVQWQGHDFSMRGMFGIEASMMSGAGHLLSFTGTDTIPAIDFLENYYNASAEKELIGGSVPATEHSVMCFGNPEDEYETYKRLLTEVYPTGIASIVSDTWDYWSILTDVLPRLKDIIMSRDGKLVIRPDSGDPVDIICGKEVLNFKTNTDKYYEFCYDMESYDGETVCINDEFYNIVGVEEHIRHYGDDCWYESDFDNLKDMCSGGRVGVFIPIISPYSNEELKGSIELLWDIFGGTINSKGYKELDPHIGLIYGDSITIDRCEEICERLKSKGFASTNIVLGIGSYTYQYNTRDTFGFAMKATYGMVNGKPINIFKKPKTDDGLKNSAKGLLYVDKDLVLHEEVSPEVEGREDNMLKPIFKDGEILIETSLLEIRSRLNDTN